MFERVCARGFAHKCTDGQERFFMPTIAAYLGDIKEINDVMGIAPNSHFSDISTLAPTKRLNEPDYEPPLRTESHMREVKATCFNFLHHHAMMQFNLLHSGHTVVLHVGGARSAVS